MTECSRRLSVSAFFLRLFAVICMLLDHIGYCLPRASFSPILRIIGRMAFPVFVFLIVNGLRYTHSKPKYALRLAIFAVISQMPFSLMTKQIVLRENGNVFFTLLAAMLCVWWASEFWKKGGWYRVLAFLPSVLVCAGYYFDLYQSDYDMRGVLLALVFFFFEGKRVLTVIGTFAALFAPTLIGYCFQLLNILRGREAVFKLPSLWTMQEAFSLLALIPIFLYCGAKGFAPKNKIAAKALQIGFYAFYPVHMLLLWLLLRR